MTEDYIVFAQVSGIALILTTRGKTTEKHNPEQNTLFLDSTVWISEMYHLSFG
jgi:hypothetical protein